MTSPLSAAWLHIATASLPLIFLLFFCSIAVSAAPGEYFVKSISWNSKLFFGGLYGTCHLDGGRPVLTDNPTTNANLASSLGYQVPIIPLYYEMVNGEVWNGNWRYVDHNNISMVRALGPIFGTGGTEYVGFKPNDLWSRWKETGGGGNTGTFTRVDMTLPLRTLIVFLLGNWGAREFHVPGATPTIVCEKVPIATQDWGFEIVTPPTSALCSVTDRTLFDRICELQNKRLFQPITGDKDLVITVEILRRLSGENQEEPQGVPAYEAIYMTGGSYDDASSQWRWHDSAERPLGQPFSRGRCRTDDFGANFAELPPYNGWAANHWSQKREPLCYDVDRDRTRMGTTLVYEQFPTYTRGAGWRARSWNEICSGSNEFYLTCETRATPLPNSGLTFVTGVGGLPYSVAMSRCRGTNTALTPAVMNTADKQAELERLLLRPALDAGTDSEKVERMNVNVVLGATYTGRSGKYPFGTGNNDGDWMWYATNTKLQTGFNNAGGVVGFAKWMSGQPTMSTARGINGDYVNSVFIVYNMKQGGWYTTNTITSDMRLICESAKAVANPTVQLIVPTTNVAVGALSQLCAINNMSPFDATSAKLQEDLIITVGKSAGANDVILLGGRYTSNVYPPNLATGQWKHSNNAAFMTGHALTTGASTTTFQSWVPGAQPSSRKSGTQESALALGYQQSAGGWLTVAVNAASVNRVACVPSSGGASAAMTLSQKLKFFTDSDRSTTPDSFGYADARCILADPTTRSLPVTSATAEAALEIAALKNPSVVTADSLVLLPAAYSTSANAWLWLASGSAFTNKFSLEDGATANTASQFQSWALGFPRKSGGRSAMWFSLRSGGWVNSESVASGSRLFACQGGNPSFDMGDKNIVSVTVPVGAPTLAAYSEQASILCSVNTPSGVPHVLTSNTDLQRFEVFFLRKARAGTMPSGVTRIATNTRYTEVVRANLKVSWAAGYPKLPETEETLVAYDMTLKGFVNVAASTAQLTLACTETEPSAPSDISIVSSDDFAGANITAPKDNDQTLFQVCALKNSSLVPLEVTNSDIQHQLFVEQMRAAVSTTHPYTATTPVLTGGRSEKGLWAWNNDANKHFAKNFSGEPIRDAYTHWPDGFQGAADGIIVASSATSMQWTSVAGDSTSFFVACYPGSLPWSPSFIITAPQGLPGPDSPFNVSAKLCELNNPPGTLLVANDELTQRGLGIVTRRTMVEGGIPMDAFVTLPRARVDGDGKVEWDDGSGFNDTYTTWEAGYPIKDATHSVLAFSSEMGQWVNLPPSAAGVPYVLACEPAPKRDGEGSDSSGNRDPGSNEGNDDEGLGDTHIFLVAVSPTSRGNAVTSSDDANPVDGWLSCAAHGGAALHVVNASVESELQTVVLQHYLNRSDTLITNTSTPVLIGAYRTGDEEEWGWVDPLNLSVSDSNISNYTNFLFDPPNSTEFASYRLSDGQWFSQDGSERVTVAACVPFDYGFGFPPLSPPNSSESSSDSSENVDWSDPFSVCNLTGGVPLRPWSANLQAALEASAAKPGMPDVIQLGGIFNGRWFDGAWQWMVKSSDTGHGPTFTQNFAVNSDPAAELLNDTFTKWAPGYPKLNDVNATAPSATILAYNKTAGGWVNVDPADGPFQIVCTINQGPDDGYIAYPPEPEKKSNGFPWWIILIIVLAVVALLALLIIVLCCCCCKKSDEYDNTFVETNDKLPEGPDKDIYYPPRDSEVPVANPLSPYVPADEAAPAKVREKRRSRQKRTKSRHTGAAIVDVDTDFMEQNTEIRDDGDAEVFSPAEDVASNHSVEEL